jgi:malate dehydrogenase
MLVGAMPRKEGMDRADLLAANGKIFTGQGAALNKVAADDVKILVTGNPANTNALIAMANAPDIPKERFNALTRLDHNRAKTQLAQKLGVHVDSITQLAIWGNHDDSMYPDLYNTKVDGKIAADLVDEAWITDTFIPTVATRGGAIIKARGLSSAASAANATIDHMRDWMLGTSDWVSMSVPSDGSYGVTEGSSPRSRACAPTAATRSSRASSCPTSPRSGSRPRWLGWSPSATRSRPSASSDLD